MKTCKICGDELVPQKKAYCSPEHSLLGKKRILLANRIKNANAKALCKLRQKERLDKKAEGKILFNGGPWLSV